MDLQEINEKLNEVSNELKNIEGVSYSRIDKMYSNESFSFFLSMVHLHDTDYEDYVLISKYVLAALKESQINKMVAIKEQKNLIEDLKQKGRSENYLDFERFKLQNYYSDLELIKDSIKNFRICPKDEEMIKPEFKNVVDCFVKMKFATFDFEDSLNPEKKIDIDILKAEIMADKLKMQTFIKEYE